MGELHVTVMALGLGGLSREQIVRWRLMPGGLRILLGLTPLD
jgi:hypothetical protein